MTDLAVSSGDKVVSYTASRVTLTTTAELPPTRTQTISKLKINASGTNVENESAVAKVNNGKVRVKRVKEDEVKVSRKNNNRSV